MLARYLEILVTVQLFRSEGSFISDEDAFYHAGKLVGLIPLLHCAAILAVIEMFAIVFHLPSIENPFIRGAILAPFMAVSAFVIFDSEYIRALQMKVRSYPALVLASRRRQARAFVWGSYIIGFIALFFLGLSQGSSLDT